jgi:hypothetical protein
LIRFWCARFILKLVSEAARCVFYYLTCVIHYDGFVGFKCVLEIIMFEYELNEWAELVPPTSLIVNAYSVTSGLILIFKMYDLAIMFIIYF